MKKSFFLFLSLLLSFSFLSCSRNNEIKINASIKAKKIIPINNLESEHNFMSFMDKNNGYYFSSDTKSLIRLTSDFDKNNNPILIVSQVMAYDKPSKIIYFGKETEIDVYDFKNGKLDFKKTFDINNNKIQEFNYKGNSYTPIYYSMDEDKSSLYEVLDTLFS